MSKHRTPEGFTCVACGQFCDLQDQAAEFEEGLWCSWCFHEEHQADCLEDAFENLLDDACE